jgi:hemolysin activation/secretion protein
VRVLALFLCSLSGLLLTALPSQAAESDASEAPAAQAAAPAAVQFEVLEYRVIGNSVLQNRDIEGVLYPRLGPHKTFADIDAAREALEVAYHAMGYATVFVDVPPQEVSDGIVRLHVTEGKLRERTISGARYFSESKLLAELPATQPGTVPKISELQNELTAANSQSADRSVIPVLKAGPVPGTMDLALKVDDHLPLHGGLELDNQYTADTDPLRATASLSYSNLFEELDSIAAQFTTTPQKPSEVAVLSLNYEFHPLGAGVRPSVSFTNSSSNVVTVGTLGVLGDGQIVSARLLMPMFQGVGELQSLTAGLDYKHFHNTINLAGIGAQIEPMTYVNLSLSYAGLWQRLSASGQPLESGSVDVAANVGPRGPTNSAYDFDSSRFEARGNYAYLHWDMSFSSPLPAGLQLTLRLVGQEALEPLVVYEQQSFAGSQGVRGYLEAEVLADSGYKGTLQLQSPSWVRGAKRWGDAFIFFDAAQSRSIDALPGEPDLTNLHSIGAGLDLLPGQNVTGTLTWAEPLMPGPHTARHESRLLFDMKGSF